MLWVLHDYWYYEWVNYAWLIYGAVILSTTKPLFLLEIWHYFAIIKQPWAGRMWFMQFLMGWKGADFQQTSWGSIEVFVQHGLSKKCLVQLQIVWLEHCPSLSWWCLRWTNLKWEQVKDFQFCMSVFLLCGFDLNSEQTRVVKREWSLCSWGEKSAYLGKWECFP